MAKIPYRPQAAATPPLVGVRVLELSHGIASATPSPYLAQLGAEVIEIKLSVADDAPRTRRRHGGYGGASALTGRWGFDLGRQPFACDLHTPEQVELIGALARDCDVFIENVGPGALAPHGLDGASLRALRPELVYRSLAADSPRGEWAAPGAYDHVLQALSGAPMTLTDARAAAPAFTIGAAPTDVAAGVLDALSTLAALYRSARADGGEAGHAARVQASLALLHPHATLDAAQPALPQRIGIRGRTTSPGASTWACADGWLATAASTPAQFASFAALLGLQDLCEDGLLLDLRANGAAGLGFVVARNFDDVQQRFADALLHRSAAEMEVRLKASGVPAERVHRLGEFIGEIEPPEPAPHGTVDAQDNVPAHAPSARVLDFDLLRRRPASRASARHRAAPHGVDSHAVLSGLGLGAADIDALRAARIIK